MQEAWRKAQALSVCLLKLYFQGKHPLQAQENARIWHCCDSSFQESHSDFFYVHLLLCDGSTMVYNCSLQNTEKGFLLKIA